MQKQFNTAIPAPYIERARELFVREPTNPILTAAQMPIPCKAVCNPAACLVGDDVLLLLRVIDNDDHSHLYVARSKDGIGGWVVDTAPLLSPSDTDAGWYDNWGCEDPRITYLEEDGLYAITYVGYSKYGAGVCLALTRDFRSVERLGMVIHPYNKDAVLFPRKIGGKYQLLHRPTSGPLENVWISESDDLRNWGSPRCILEENDQPGWDSGKVGAGPPPLEMPDGWFLIFHGVRQLDHGWEYRFGMALLDKDDPSRLVRRWPEWVFGPQEPYEIRNDNTGVVFPTGVVVKDNRLYVYYGAADTTVALTTADLEILHCFRDALRQELESNIQSQ